MRVVNEGEGTPRDCGALKVKKRDHFKEEEVFTLLNAATRSRKLRSGNQYMKTLRATEDLDQSPLGTCNTHVTVLWGGIYKFTQDLFTEYLLCVYVCRSSLNEVMEAKTDGSMFKRKIKVEIGAF